ncbi:hypothetical protein CFREI_05670 [Corynebacterium freiburgense]|nr:hypothetical protein CFREI_05670 [Corynebacterium freiburgense]
MVGGIDSKIVVAVFWQSIRTSAAELQCHWVWCWYWVAYIYGGLGIRFVLRLR